MTPPIKYLIILFFPFFGIAQNSSTNNIVNVIALAEGDLNNDGIPDLAVVTQDTLSDYRPYELSVFIVDEKGLVKLKVRTKQAIEPQYPDGVEGYKAGIGFESVLINKGELLIANQLLRGHYQHKFRFQNNNFELIDYAYVSSDGLGKIYEINYNLASGELRELTTSYIDDVILKDSKRILKLDKLPTLDNFKPFSGDYY